MLKRERGLDADAIARLPTASGYSPPPLTDAERARSTAASLDGAPPYVWRLSRMARSDSSTSSATSARRRARRWRRAPLDLRVNTLKAEREEALAPLADLGPSRRAGRRMACASSSADARNPAIHAEPAFIKGRDRGPGRGLAARGTVRGAKPGEQVIDLCAGAGGKTLALAAAMENKGRLVATDDDKRRLAPIHDRLARCGAHNVEVRTPKSVGTEIEDLQCRIDLVLIDAPCTGIGAWRRNPDAKWRMRPGALEQPSRNRSRCWSGPCRWSYRAGASPTSPVRCWRRRTATGARTSSRASRIFRGPPAEMADALASAPICSAGGAASRTRAS